MLTVSVAPTFFLPLLSTTLFNAFIGNAELTLPSLPGFCVGKTHPEKKQTVTTLEAAPLVG